MNLPERETISAGVTQRPQTVNILLVDDNPEHRLLITRNLRRGIQNVSIEEAENGGDCMTRVDNKKFDLVLLDYSLPDMNGFEVLGYLKKIRDRMPVIMITGREDDQIVEEAIRRGASDYIVKSKEFLDHLVTVVERTLAQQALKSQLDRSKEELFRRNEELSLLLDATTAIASELDLDKVLHILAERIGRAVGCTFVKILLMSDEGVGLVVKAAYPVYSIEWDPALGDAVEVRPGSPIMSVVSDQAPLLLHAEQIKELDVDPALKRCLLGSLADIQSLLIMPVAMQGERLGFVVLGERRRWERSPFTMEKSGLAFALIQHAGIAITNARLYQSLERANLETIIGLAEALETRDAYTRGHSDRSVEYARALAQELGLTPEQADRLQYGAILHDIGKIGIPDNILNKPAQLTAEEYELMKGHPVKGANIVSKIHSLERIAPVIRHHHEHWDGTGYPDGIAGENIPIESRIVAVLDSFDAMVSDRVYRKAPGRDYAISELRRCSGAQYDPRVVEAFLKVLGAGSN